MSTLLGLPLTVSPQATLAQFWSTLGPTEGTIEVCFYGATPDASVVSLSSGEPVVQMHVTSGPGAVTIKPSAVLKTHRITMRPTKCQINALGERDHCFEAKQVHELVLEYSFKLDEDAEATPQALPLNDKLYESVYESQLLVVHDKNKKYVGCTDCWPSSLKLKKGEYVARLQVRHDDVRMLEKLKGMPLALDKPLGSEVGHWCSRR